VNIHLFFFLFISSSITMKKFIDLNVKNSSPNTLPFHHWQFNQSSISSSLQAQNWNFILSTHSSFY